MKNYPIRRVSVTVVFILSAFFSISAQTDKELGEAAIQSLTLFKQQRFVEAIPHFEIVIKAIPDNANARFMYGWCLVVKSKQTEDTNEAKELSAKALDQFVKAKELGLKSQENDSLIALLSGKAVPGAEPQYSQNKDAEKAMVEAENFYSQSKYDEAIKSYDKALALDPKIYRAALGAGDSYTAKGDWENAEKYYQRGITINPNLETAYRYSGTPLMKQKKYDLARDRYVEAFITEPYSRLSPRGISQWAQVTGAKLGHPEVEIPEVTFAADGKAVPKVSIKADVDWESPWLAYLAVRETWKKQKFAKSFPNETVYRHSLQEEAEALRAAVAAAAQQKSPNKQFELLGKMDADGVLEAFILMAKPDDGIAADHPAYLKDNRAKMRKYVVNYVIHQ